ncbi:hypothetical protein [Mucilaginibacter sp.]|jgi:hypothetical protein|uniref:baeRF3 domain-containing protein n=1 Tax=Mucilaginibacter sp. TaxID=1882438 RepID=UPI002CBCF2DF|nr:hypothetical protein [Mucilaginibacter sp.]HTI60226.1 hypothetical protein [Mucilaginibacter sp.]
MNPEIDNQIHDLLNVKFSGPVLSIILPLQPEISLKTKTAHALKIAADKAENQLSEICAGESGRLIIQKLHSVIGNLVIPPRKKGLAIFISPECEKRFFLDVPVEEKVIVNDFFEIRDVVYDSKQSIPLLLIVMSSKACRVFKGDQYHLNPVHLDVPESYYAYVDDVPERVGNFSDMTERKHAITEKFLRHIDDGVDKLQHENPLPIIICGAEKVLGHFKKLSKHSEAVIACVPGNYDDADVNHLLKLIAGDLAQVKQSRQKELIDKLQDAAGKKRLSYGISDVWKNASAGKGSLLIAEMNYHYAFALAPESYAVPDGHHTRTHDLVSGAVEYTLKYGGDVEFVEDGSLENYGRIALIHYY